MVCKIYIDIEGYTMQRDTTRVAKSQRGNLSVLDVKAWLCFVIEDFWKYFVKKLLKAFENFGIKACRMLCIKAEVVDILSWSVAGYTPSSIGFDLCNAKLLLFIQTNSKDGRMRAEDKVVLFILYSRCMDMMHPLYRLFVLYFTPSMHNHSRKNVLSNASLKVGWAKMVRLACEASISPASAIAIVAISSSAFGARISAPRIKPSLST